MSADVLAPFVVPLLACAGHLVLSAVSCWRHGRLSSLLRKCRLPSRHPDDEFGRLAEAEVEKCLLQRVIASSEILGVFELFYFLSRVYVATAGLPGWLTDMQLHSMTAGNVTFLMIRLCPRRLLQKTLPLAYALVMASLVTLICFSETSSVVPVLQVIKFSVAFRVTFSLIFGQVLSTLLCNMLVSAVSSYIYARTRVEPDQMASSPLTFAAMEIGLSLVIFALTWLSRTALKRESLNLVKYRSVRIESSAMTTLLGLACDVVVELDASLHVAEHSPTLSAILSLNNNTKGLVFTQYMPHEDDRERFEKMFVGSTQGGMDTCEQGAMTLTMRDSMNNNISVDVFFVKIPETSGSRSSSGGGSSKSCFVGIREIADQPIARLPSAHSNNHVKSGDSQGRGFSDKASVQGTAPVVQSQALCGDQKQKKSKDAAADDDAASVASGNSKQSSASQWRSIDDRFQLTGTAAKQLVLLEAIMQWNIPYPRKSCCVFHAEIKELRAQTKALSCRPCSTSFHLAGDCQCVRCGAIFHLDDDEDRAHCPGSPYIRGQSRCHEQHRDEASPREDHDAGATAMAAASDSRPLDKPSELIESL